VALAAASGFEVVVIAAPNFFQCLEVIKSDLRLDLDKRVRARQTVKVKTSTSLLVLGWAKFCAEYQL
jgi:hypothetical protein